MQRATLNGELISQRFHPNVDRAFPYPLSIHKSSWNPATVSVIYRDGAILTFLFDHTTTIVDLMTMVSRAGTVRKVVL